MAEFAANILKTESLYYRLSRATLRDGILHLSAGGSAETEITSLQLTNLTEYFRVAYIADKYCDSYTSNIRIKVYAKSKDGNNFNYTFFPCDTEGNMFLQEFQVKATSYEKLTWRIESDIEITVSLWELCPEAMDINAQTIIDGVQQSLPRLLYDYNTWPLTVEDGEVTVGLITFRLLDRTDLQGHFIMSFFASEAAILTMRFYTNEIEELFAPLTYDIRKGYNSIGIPHCYLHRSAGFYSVMATAQVSAGIITIPTRGVLYSIDGGYLAKRELDVAMDVQDLAIRQTSISYGPDEVWLVGIDAGEILVRKRDYNEVNPNVTWTPVLSLGSGISAAIEFNGYWDVRIGTVQYTIETEEEPWYFWVDDHGVLWGRHGTDDTSLVQLDENVSLVRAIRGYKSEQYLDQDQGLVVAYLKEGLPYYRRYIWDNLEGLFRWEMAELILFGELFDDIHVNRLNDYRLSFELSNDVHNLWLYTDRTYVGNALPTEMGYFFNTTSASLFSYLEIPFDESVAILSTWGEVGAMYLTVTVNRILIIADSYYDLHDLFSFRGGLIWNKYDWDHKNTVDYVDMLIDDELQTTTFVFHLLKPTPPSNMIININPDRMGWLHMLLADGTEIQCLEVLTAHLNLFPTQRERIQSSLQVVDYSFVYDSLSEQTLQVDDWGVSPLTVSSTSFEYKRLSNKNLLSSEKCNSTLSVETLLFEYSQTGDEPI